MSNGVKAVLNPNRVRTKDPDHTSTPDSPQARPRMVLEVEVVGGVSVMAVIFARSRKKE